MRLSPSFLPIALCCLALIPCAASEGPAETGRTTTEEIDRLLADLDSDDFSLRTRAFEQLQAFADDRDSRQLLSDSLERAVVGGEISFEVRKQLERLRRGLPSPELPPSPPIDADGVDRLIEQLGDDSYGRRLGAQSRLHWLVGNASGADLVYGHLKRCASSDRLSPEQVRLLGPVYTEARAAWLESERRKEDPVVSSEQLDDLVERLAEPTKEPAFPLTGQPLVVTELRDLLAGERNVAPIAQALETRLAEGSLAPEAERQFRELLDLTKPAMAAEFWIRGRHTNIQRLLVNVPSETEGVGTSHFDRIDDETAHVLCGVNLSQGDYPVGVAIPHPIPDPRYAEAFFHLVNLPTPRRRMAYEYRVKGDEAFRFQAIGRRTLRRYLDQKIPITPRDLAIITQFDPREVSRFAGRYVATMDDRALEPQDPLAATVPVPLQPPAALEGSSIHGMLCSWLAEKGTREAVPDLLEAIAKNRVLPPQKDCPYRFDRLAALAVAGRDPWPEVDGWLAEVLAQRESLLVDQSAGPELGATAAALLLRRHGGGRNEFGLVECSDGTAKQYGLEAYRYAGPDGPERVAQWWATHRDRQTEETR